MWNKLQIVTILVCLCVLTTHQKNVAEMSVFKYKLDVYLTFYSKKEKLERKNTKASLEYL